MGRWVFQELWSRGNQEEVIGDVKFGHQFVNVSSQVVDYQLANGSVIQVRESKLFVAIQFFCQKLNIFGVPNSRIL